MMICRRFSGPVILISVFLSGYKLVMLVRPVPVPSAPRFRKQTSAFAKTKVRIDEGTCKICQKTGCKCVYKLKLRSRIIDMTFNIAELTPVRVTQTMTRC